MNGLQQFHPRSEHILFSFLNVVPDKGRIVVTCVSGTNCRDWRECQAGTSCYHNIFIKQKVNTLVFVKGCKTNLLFLMIIKDKWINPNLLKDEFINILLYNIFDIT